MSNLEQNLEQTLVKITPGNEKAARRAQERLDSLTQPPGSLGVLEDIVITLASITGNAMPRVDKKVLIIMAGDHGVTDEGVSAFPKAVSYTHLLMG